MSQARALYQVQELELGIIERTKKIKAIHARLQDDETVKALQARFDAARSSLKLIVKRIHEMETQIEAVVTKQQATESRLYSGHVKNPKELQDMQMEVDALTRRRAELDDQLLLLMMERDEAHQTFVHSEGALNKAQAEQEAEHQNLLEEKISLTREIEELMAERKNTLRQIQPDVLKTYNSLRTAKANRPVSVLKDRTCKVCGITQNNSIVADINRDGGLVKCQNCGRILIKL